MSARKPNDNLGCHRDNLRDNLFTGLVRPNDNLTTSNQFLQYAFYMFVALYT
jgi:hypothetical protein